MFRLNSFFVMVSKIVFVGWWWIRFPHKMSARLLSTLEILLVLESEQALISFYVRAYFHCLRIFYWAAGPNLSRSLVSSSMRRNSTVRYTYAIRHSNNITNVRVKPIHQCLHGKTTYNELQYFDVAKMCRPICFLLITHSTPALVVAT